MFMTRLRSFNMCSTMNLTKMISRLYPQLSTGISKDISSRCMSKYIYKKVSSDHVYKNLYPWTSKEQLADELYENIVHNQGFLIAINKPYGIGVYRPEEGGIIRKSASGVGECEIYVSDVLPILQSKLNLRSKLEVIKSTDRYSSGLMLLSSRKNVAHNVTKCLKRGKSFGVPSYTYRAIVMNVPLIKNSIIDRVGIRLIDIRDTKQKSAIIYSKVTSSALKRGEVRSALVQLGIVSLNNMYNVALVDLLTSTSRWHFVRVYLAHRLAPVLGDAMYSQRVKMVLGKAIAISPHNSASYGSPTLSEKVCNCLQLPKENVLHVPTHIHLHQMTLTGYFGETDLVLKAEPHERFLWTAQKLDILPEVKIVAQQIV